MLKKNTSPISGLIQGQLVLNIYFMFRSYFFKQTDYYTLHCVKETMVLCKLLFFDFEHLGL